MKEKISTIEGEFVDFRGEVHKFIIAAVSEAIIGSEVQVYDDVNETYIDDAVLVDKCVKLGVAVCNPKDTYNKALGEKIAISKARANYGYAMYSTMPGLINTVVVDALLKQEAEFIISNPARVIPGYWEEKKRWDEKQAFQKKVDALSEEDKAFYNELKSGKHEAVWKLFS